ncbi:MAG: hypothetical protein ACO3HP_05830 [Candidatus Nanopelagicaceae bacterium]
MKMGIEWQDVFGKWHHYQWVHNEKDAYRIAVLLSSRKKQRARICDSSGALIDVITS